MLSKLPSKCDTAFMQVLSWLKAEQRWHIVVLLIVLAPLFLWNAAWDESANPDAEAAAIAAWQLSQTGTLDLSGYEVVVENLDSLSRWFVEGRDDTIVSNRPPGLIGVALPSYAIAGANQFSIKPSTITAMLLTVISLIIVWGLLRKTTDTGFATVAAGVLALGTTTWAISSAQLWPHGPDQLWAAIALAGMSVERHTIAGGAFALLILTRPVAAFFGAASAISESFQKRSWRPILVIGAISSVGLAVLVAYNLAVYGELTIRGGYPSTVTSGAVERFAVADYLRNVWAMFFGGSNGFLLLSPVLGVASYALVRYWRRVPSWARSGALAGLVYLLVHSALNRASGGLPLMYRYPLEAITMASAGFGIASWILAKESSTGRKALIVSSVLSIAIQVYYVFFLSCFVYGRSFHTCPFI